MNARCIASAPGVDVSGNIVRGNRCRGDAH